MSRTTRTFDTAAEAAAFLEGVEYVNDSAIEAHIDPAAPTVVVIDDEDLPEDEDGNPEEAP